MSETNSAWKIWTENPCFRELVSMCDEIKAESIADEDRIPTAELDIAIIAECRGVRLGLKKLLDLIDYKANPTDFDHNPRGRSNNSHNSQNGRS